MAVSQRLPHTVPMISQEASNRSKDRQHSMIEVFRRARQFLLARPCLPCRLALPCLLVCPHPLSSHRPSVNPRSITAQNSVVSRELTWTRKSPRMRRRTHGSRLANFNPDIMILHNVVSLNNLRRSRMRKRYHTLSNRLSKDLCRVLSLNSMRRRRMKRRLRTP